MISTIILTNDSEDVIEDCLKSLDDFADEIIVLDDHSTDGTVANAKQFTEQIL